MKTSRSPKRKGFTIIETLIAIGVIGVLLSIFLTLFVPAKSMVRAALTRQESEKLTSVLRAELDTLRPHETASANAKRSTDKEYISAFDKAFYWFSKSRKPSSALVIFSYRADTSKPLRKNGSYPALRGNRNIPSNNGQIMTVACSMDDGSFKNEIRNSIGPVFIVKMTQLVPQNNGDFKLSNKPGFIEQARTPGEFASAENAALPWGAIVYYRAEFYQMSPPDPARYSTRKWEGMGKPLFSANMSFRR